jgi:demethylmenaquinone methyltransferase/2-methoxy-6-polyprenyl-1,4-benzoquinol methylase
MVDYYARRAGEYERIYQKPERQGELSELKELLRTALRGRRAIEVACGTGYWTKVAAASAVSIDAFDINDSTLEIARNKSLDSAKVTFAVGDAFQLLPPDRRFDAAFAMFWWSHIPKAALSQFLRGLHATLLPGAAVIFVDNTFVSGNSTPTTRSDADGNTYQTRRLENGQTFEVLKNYPTEDEFRELLHSCATQIELKVFRYYWWLNYRLPESH